MPTDFYRRLGQAIAQARRGADVTQVELADRLDVAQTQVSAWERAAKRVDVETLCEIAAALRCSVCDLLAAAGVPTATEGVATAIMSSRLTDRQKAALILVLEQFD